MADAIKVQGVRKIEVATINGVDYAAVDVEFVNTGSQGVKFCKGQIDVVFDTERGWVEGRTKKDWKTKTVARITEGTGVAKTIEAESYETSGPKESAALKMGDITLGEKYVSEEVAQDDLGKLAQNPIEIPGVEADGNPITVKKTLYVKLENTGTVKNIANLIGDPSIPVVMRLTIRSHTALLLKGKGELDDGVERTITLNMVPSLPRDYLFK
jgi:hypothetical protein